MVSIKFNGRTFELAEDSASDGEGPGAVYEAAHGIQGIAATLYGPVFDDLPEEAQLLTFALGKLSRNLFTAFEIPQETAQRMQPTLDTSDK